MKYCTFEYHGMERVGVILDEYVVADITSGYAACLDNMGNDRAFELAYGILPPALTEIIKGGELALKAVSDTVAFLKSEPQIKEIKGRRILYPLGEIKLKAPVQRPSKIFSIAINNREGFESAIKPEGEPHPLYFIKFSSCITGPYDPIEIPDIGIVGPEIEIAAIIAKKGKNIPIEKAGDYIFGYIVHNDITAFELRDKREQITVVRAGGVHQKFTYAGRYKCFDTFAPMGPWLVTKDEIGNIENRKIECRLNGQTCQLGSTSDMYFKFPYLISYLSGAHTLEPGDIISGGTVKSASGWNIQKIDLRRVGGILESEIDGIGILKNPINPI